MMDIWPVAKRGRDSAPDTLIPAVACCSSDHLLPRRPDGGKQNSDNFKIYVGHDDVRSIQKKVSVESKNELDK